MNPEYIIVLIKNKDGLFRKKLSKDEYNINENGQIKLPKDHYSVGYISRIIDNFNIDDCPFLN